MEHITGKHIQSGVVASCRHSDRAVVEIPSGVIDIVEGISRQRDGIVVFREISQGHRGIGGRGGTDGDPVFIQRHAGDIARAGVREHIDRARGSRRTGDEHFDGATREECDVRDRPCTVDYRSGLPCL